MNRLRHGAHAASDTCLLSRATPGAEHAWNTSRSGRYPLVVGRAQEILIDRMN
jgi:hypothetical protein